MGTGHELQTVAPTGPLGLFAPPSIHIECEAFVGSLGTLFDCLRRPKVDLLDVPLFPICEAYTLYLVDHAGQDLEAAATAVAALAYLVERKAWLLIPAPPEEEPEYEDPPELIEPTAHEYAPAIELLSRRMQEREQRFFRAGEGELGYEIPFDLGEVTADDLARAFERLILRAQPEPPPSLGKPRRSLTEQMELVLRVVDRTWRPLDGLIESPFTRLEAVWWFLALLELIRLGQVAVRLDEGEVVFRRRMPEDDLPVRELEADA